MAAASEDKGRQEVILETWQFAGDQMPQGSLPAPDTVWKDIRVPHVFRQSGLPDESAGWYRRTLDVPASTAGRRCYLFLDGAASVKDVWMNGQRIGRHVGAYTASAFDLTPALKPGAANELLVRVSNRDDEIAGTMSRSTLFYVNGGMFRTARLVSVGEVHIFPDMGSSGVYLTPQKITNQSAEVKTRTMVRNPSNQSVEVLVRHSITTPSGRVLPPLEVRQAVAPGATSAVEAVGTVAKPQLWDLLKPKLYSVRSEVLVGGKISDAVVNPLGFRTITIQNKRFAVNGREVQFRGVNKHEQSEYAWNAVGDEPVREWQWLMEMGGNMIRLAHYPHSRLDYTLADRNGLAVWAENGFAGHAWKGNRPEDKKPTPDGERITREMVRQNWNHPSILFWSAGNETEVKTVSHYARIIRGEDPDRLRLVTYASNGPDPVGCDFIARNTYDGWYGSGHLSGFSELPRNAFISETGAGDWITHHIPYGTWKWKVDQYEPEEYAEMFTEYRLQTVCRTDVRNRPMFLWWNFREFYDRKFKANRNTKGLVTLAGSPKDLYYLFQAFFRPEKPVVHLAGRHHFLRKFAADNGIKAYGNVARLTLTVNGVVKGTKPNGEYRIPDSEHKKKDGTVTPIPGIPVDNVFFWQVPLAEGRNVVEVSDGQGHRDHMIIVQQTPGTPLVAEPNALVQDLVSTNPANPATFIDRPVEEQGPFYSEVDGSSDNTFDEIPQELTESTWIATRRMSDPQYRSGLRFKVHPRSRGATVHVVFSTGTHPVVTLEPRQESVATAAASMTQMLQAAGFKKGGDMVWRNHALDRADAVFWSRRVGPGEVVEVPAHTLDYAVLLQPLP